MIILLQNTPEPLNVKNLSIMTQAIWKNDRQPRAKKIISKIIK